MSISEKMIQFGQRASWIRKMFEEGARLKALYGQENVFDFSLGNPDLPPPPRFKEVLQTLAGQENKGQHGYMPNAGYVDVRSAVADRLAKEQGVVLSADDVLMTCGAAGALNVVMKSLLNPGDEVILLAPYFVEYNFYVDNHGGISKVVATAEDFTLDLDTIRAAITEKTKAIIINSPNNPTGQIYSEGSLLKLAELLYACGKNIGNTIYLVADEPYRKIVFDGTEVPPVLRSYRNSIVVSSYSKDLSLPGERIGYIAAHPEIDERAPLLGAMTLANRILGFVNAPALMQRVVAQLQGETIDCTRYAKRREMFCKILAEAGFEFVPPKGAFYIFPKSPLADDAEFVSLLLKQKILAVPGRGFGTPGYFRLAFCVDEGVIEHSAEGFRRAFAEATGK